MSCLPRLLLLVIVIVIVIILIIILVFILVIVLIIVLVIVLDILSVQHLLVIDNLMEGFLQRLQLLQNRLYLRLIALGIQTECSLHDHWMFTEYAMDIH
jgi:hypothetical protein